MRRNLPGSFFGTNPMGETTRWGKGDSENGPDIRPKVISELIFCWATMGYFVIDDRFFVVMVWGSGPLNGISNPNVNPSTRYWIFGGLYPLR